MATHDYVIDNSTGANVRADLNLVFQAILTNNSSSSAPSTTAAYMWWADTSNGILKIRNSANNAWVELLQLDGTLTLEDGAVGTPALAFRDDLNTGIFSSAADTFNVATGGVERMEIGSTAIVLNDGGNDVDFIVEGSSQANLFHVNAGDNTIGIRTATPDRLFTLNASATTRMNIKSGSSSTAGIEFGDSDDIDAGFIIYDNSNNSFQVGVNGAGEKLRLDSSGRLLLGTTTGASTDSGQGGTLTIANTNPGITLRSGTSNVGSIYFSDGTSGDSQLRGLIQYNHSSNFLRFWTDASERMRIDSSGRLLVGTTTQFGDGDDKLMIENGTTGGRIAFGSSATFAEPIIASMHAYWADNKKVAAITFFGGSDTTNKDDGTVRFHTSSANNLAERMRIDSSGRLLVGLTSTNQDSAIVAVSSISGGGQGVITALDSSSNDFGCGLVVGKNSTTTTSAQRFIQFYSDTLTQPMGGIVGNGTENVQFTTLSDERYKKNIKPISNILEKINKLNKISFDWKHKEESVNAGFIAQNVQEIFPEYVVDNIGNDEANKKMGTTGGMSAGYIAVLTAAIQELSAKVAALEAA